MHPFIFFLSHHLARHDFSISMAITDVQYVFADRTLFQMTCEISQHTTMHEKTKISPNKFSYLQTPLGPVLYQDQIYYIQYIPRNMHTVFALLCFVVVIHWLIFPYPSGLLPWHCGNLTIAPVPAKQPWWIWIKYFMWIHYERLHNHNKAKHNKTVCIFLGIYCITMGYFK